MRLDRQSMKHKVTTVALNASIDKTCYVSAWSKGMVTRATESIATAGGKGGIQVGQIKVLFWFDVEDFINPESEEALLGLLDILDERGIVGIFKLVGEKIRVLERNGREDILAKLRRHEIGYHTDWHSVHPVVTEYCEPLGFREGAESFLSREGGGFGDLARITGRPVRCYGQPGQAWAPQSFPALRRWGVEAYLDGHDQVSMNGRPFWYGGLLHLASLEGLMFMPLQDGALDEAMAKFDRLCEKQRDEEVGFISIFYHPTEFVFEEFWDAVNFSEGRNPPKEQWVKPRFRPDGDTRKYLNRVGEFIDYTLTKPGVTYARSQEIVTMERSDRRPLSREEVVRFARQTGNEWGYVTDGALCLSASELFSTFREYVAGADTPVPELLYGPEREVGDRIAKGGLVVVADVLEALRKPMPEVLGYKHLPDSYAVGDSVLGPVTMACTLAAIIGEGLRPEDAVVPRKGRLVPERHSANGGEWAGYWSIFPTDFKAPNVVELSRLQTWTMKPAIF
ncbi:hypothetical protein B1748_03120 [Paenibacillus sp. MY03]|uniref:hypothetical protein n=1 Tax=Paenibacillus sp. MY03 TaxID=302980 RepID=UPI000B3D1FF5|nr:hypothetical protein [Paenibacillus sp. MY03]OUS77789.1 hypothetical protein B1748_03120 [Paenibacillus sp. MY03]